MLLMSTCVQIVLFLASEGHTGESTVPNLGVVVQQLVQCVEHHHCEKAALDLMSRKLASIPNMNSTELKDVCYKYSLP
jgi:hypothetical protein